MLNVFVIGVVIIVGIVCFTVYQIKNTKDCKIQKRNSIDENNKEIKVGKQYTIFDKEYKAKINSNKFDKVGACVTFDLEENFFQQFVIDKYVVELISNDFTYINKDYIHSELGFKWDKSENHWCKEFRRCEDLETVLKNLIHIGVRFKVIVKLDGMLCDVIK